MDWQASKDAIAVNDGTIREVTVAPFATGSEEPMTRVELALVSAADYDVRPGPRGLVIEVSPLAEMGSLDEPSGDTMASDVDPWSTPARRPTEEVQDASEVVASDQPADAATARRVRPRSRPGAAPATKLERVEAAKAGEGVVIHLVADGSVDNAASFTLADPPRLVVDLDGMKSVVPKPKVEVGRRLRAARARRHARRQGARGGGRRARRRSLRRPPRAAGAERSGDRARRRRRSRVGGGGGLRAGADGRRRAGAGRARARGRRGARAGARRPLRPASPRSRASSSSRSRIAIACVIRSEQAVDYLVYEPDPDTVVLSLTNALLEPEAAVRIAPEAPGPVSLVTAFEQPDVKTPEVRVVMKRAPNLKPAVTREGAILVVEFPHTGEAARPP